jgi:hypothetical protein
MDRRAGLGGEERRSGDGEVNFGPVICKYPGTRAVAVVLSSVFLVACSSQPGAAPAPDPSTVLQAIPPADAARYERIHDMKNWRNPYLIVRTDGVSLLDSADSAEIHLKPDELLAALARLPASNWPYGRVVAAAENGLRSSEQDGVAIRRNRGIVGGILAGAHVAVMWVPSA